MTPFGNRRRRFKYNLAVRPAYFRCLFSVAAAGVAILLVASSAIAQSGDATRGRELLSVRGCLGCHAILGSGGDTAPELGLRAPERWSPARMAAIFWNHAVFTSLPENRGERGETNLTPGEARDLYAFFASLWLFDPPGDPTGGKEVFEEKCGHCHSAGTVAGAPPPVSRWNPFRDLISLGEQLWNHGPAMLAVLKENNLRWPELSAKAAADLITYVNGVSQNDAPTQTALEPDGERGRQVFEQLGCSSCHIFGPATSPKIDLLRALRREPSSGALAVAMVNHWPKMQAAARQRRVPLTPLPPGSMLDLVTFFQQQVAETEVGNRARGEHLFRLKGCLACHGMPRSGAPELKGKGRRYRTLGFAALLWRHDKRSHSVAALAYPVVGWPRLSATDISDLIAFLNGGY